jgi:hypothetical protein
MNEKNILKSALKLLKLKTSYCRESVVVVSGMRMEKHKKIFCKME